jgi:integrase
LGADALHDGDDRDRNAGSDKAIFNLRSLDDRVTIANALRFCILTAVRTNEAIGADWSEFDLTKKVWRIPAARMKIDTDHDVPLSDAAIKLLGEPQKSGLVFRVSGTRTGAITPTGLDKLLKQHRSGVTVHGFRACFSSWAEDAGFKPNVIEAALAHQKGDASTRAYLRSELLPARRELMNAWAQFATDNRN